MKRVLISLLAGLWVVVAFYVFGYDFDVRDGMAGLCFIYATVVVGFIYFAQG